MLATLLLHLNHALKYKPYQFHDRVICTQYAKEPINKYKFKHIRFRGLIQFAHFSKIGNPKREGLIISSYEERYNK